MTADRSEQGEIVAVTGAAGKTGRAVVAALTGRHAGRSAGQPAGRPTVRAIVHRPLPIGDELNAAAKIVTADLRDPPGMRAALTGAGAVYLIAPNLADDEPALMAAALTACRESGVRRVVYHSVMHPFAPAMPHHLDKAQVESVLHDSEFDWTIVQPASYFENALGVWDDITIRARWPVPYATSARFTPVALADVAAAAARVLLEDGHRHATYELAGPQDLSTADMAAIAAKILGTTVTAQRIPVPDTTPPRLRAMFEHYSVAGFRGSPNTLAALVDRRPTTFAAWLRLAVASRDRQRPGT